MEYNKYEIQTYSYERLKDLLREINKEDDPKFYDKVKTLIAGKEFGKEAAKLNPPQE